MISEDGWLLNKGRSIIIWQWYWYFIFCRYIFKNQKKAGLQELGPRFTLKLSSLQRGSFDSKFGEYEWVHKVCSIQLLVLSITLRLYSHLSVHEDNSRWSVMWTNHFYKYSHQNSGAVPVCGVQGLDLVLSHKMVLKYSEYPVPEHNANLCRCPCTSVWAPNVNTA